MALLGLVPIACAGGSAHSPDPALAALDVPTMGNPDELLIVDCLLPAKVKKLGTQLTYLAPRRPVKTSASDCEIRGGEYTSWDRANFATSLKIWLPKATEGDAQAQNFVGEIFVETAFVAVAPKVEFP